MVALTPGTSSPGAGATRGTSAATDGGPRKAEPRAGQCLYAGALQGTGAFPLGQSEGGDTGPCQHRAKAGLLLCASRHGCQLRAPAGVRPTTAFPVSPEDRWIGQGRDRTGSWRQQPKAEGSQLHSSFPGQDAALL